MTSRMHPREESDGRDLRGTYAAVLVIEALVILMLWSFARYFG